MARDLQFTYGATTIGGSSANTPVDKYRIRHGYPRSTFSCEFLVTGTTYSNFASACTAIESALRTPRQALAVTLSGNSALSLDPATNANSGFNADPTLERVSDAVENWGLVRRYRFTVTFERPADLAGQSGRREETVTVHADLMKRRVVTFQGTWTAMPGSDARAQYAASMGAHCTAVLAAIDPTATWVQVSEDQPSDDPGKLVTGYVRVYWEVVNGRRESTVAVDHTPAGVATVTVTGVYVQTLGPTTSARTNYGTYEAAHSTAVLAALGVTYYELVREATRDNEQDQTLDFTRVYRELIHQQSPGTYEDAQILNDTIEISTVRYPLNDSPVPPKSAGAGAQVNAPPAVPVPGVTQDRGPAGGSLPSTQDRETGSAQVRKLVDLRVQYTAWLDRSVADLKAKWDGTLRGHMYAMVASKLRVSAALVDSETVQLDVPNNRVVCSLLLKGLEGALFELEINVAKNEEMGVLATPRLSGRAHSYLVQQGPPRTTYARSVRAVFQTGGFNVQDLMGAPPAGNLVLLRRTTPVSRVRQYGAVGLGLGLLSITEVQFAEEWLLVGDAGGGGGGGTGGGGGVNAVPGTPAIGHNRGASSGTGYFNTGSLWAIGGDASFTTGGR